MSWFSKRFGKISDSSTINNQAPDALVESNVNVLENLFVDNNPPAQDHEQVIENSSSLKSWLEQDFSRKGFEDGYCGHSAEMLVNKVRSIKADFRFKLNLKIDAARQEVMSLESHKIDLQGMSESMVKKADIKINSIKTNITELEAEIALSTIDEGHVMIAIHQYRDGFIRGTEAYQEEKLIAGSTGLFN
jgi:hypothetical protein